MIKGTNQLVMQYAFLERAKTWTHRLVLCIFLLLALLLRVEGRIAFPYHSLTHVPLPHGGYVRAILWSSISSSRMRLNHGWCGWGSLSEATHVLQIWSGYPQYTRTDFNRSSSVWQMLLLHSSHSRPSRLAEVHEEKPSKFLVRIQWSVRVTQSVDGSFKGTNV